MQYFFITGTSKGLGKSLVELLLKDETNFVYGFSRSCTITHDHYKHETIDFGNLEEVENYAFPVLKNAEKIVLINNAGVIGGINHVGALKAKNLVNCYNVNLLAPMLLANAFVSSYAEEEAEKVIVNISSGAGRSPVDGWSVYCSSKAGLDMFSQVLQQEQAMKGTNCSVLSLAPGIVDTAMQGEIREAGEANFSNVEQFIAYKENGDLTPPEVTSELIKRFIDDPNIANDVLCSVREVMV